jgi:acetyl-CoA synthetase
MASRHFTRRSLAAPAWVPSPAFIDTTNMAWLMKQVGVGSYEEVHRWSVQHREDFWKLVIGRLGIRLRRPFSRVMDLSGGVESPCWLPDARLNIVESCFTAPPKSPAIIYQAEGGEIKSMSVEELEALSQNVAANLKRLGFSAGDPLAIIMPMTAVAVAIYLGIIMAGAIVVGIADSFQPREIAQRLKTSKARAVFVQDVNERDHRQLPLYANVIQAAGPMAIVLPASEKIQMTMRPGDVQWDDFLQPIRPEQTHIADPGETINILFSSGTTGDAKAVPWTQTTPIKCAMDAHFHQNVHAGDLLVWPTNLGWMMGPWLVFASLLNGATLGLFYGAPTGREFGEFVQNSKATMLGVVPGLVKTWRNSRCMDRLDWSRIKLFSSTGECSSADDMGWLMQFAGGKPVIEYCGGTEIGGGYITGTLTKACEPGTFNAPALGLDIVILDLNGRPTDSGELFIVPPSIGLSTALLNQDHHEIYFSEIPTSPDGQPLRRHGDQMQKIDKGLWCGLGRADDTMNLGGIKVSSAEIETVLRSAPGVLEVATVAVSPGGGPSSLVIYAVRSEQHDGSREDVLENMQEIIRREMNPLFKIHDLVIVESLPKTGSNKIARKFLRDQWAMLKSRTVIDGGYRAAVPADDHAQQI